MCLQSVRWSVLDCLFMKSFMEGGSFGCTFQEFASWWRRSMNYRWIVELNGWQFRTSKLQKKIPEGLPWNNFRRATNSICFGEQPWEIWRNACVCVCVDLKWPSHTHTKKYCIVFFCRNRSASHILHPSLHHFNSFYVKYCEILIPWRYVFMSHVNSVHSNKAESNEILRYLWGPKVFNMVKVVRCFVAA